MPFKVTEDGRSMKTQVLDKIIRSKKKYSEEKAQILKELTDKKQQEFVKYLQLKMREQR